MHSRVQKHFVLISVIVIFIVYVAILYLFDKLNWSAVTSGAAIIAILYSAHSFSVSTVLTRQSLEQNADALRLSQDSIDLSVQQIKLAEDGLRNAKRSLEVSRQQLILASAPLLSLDSVTTNAASDDPWLERYVLSVRNLGTGIAKNVRLTYERTDQLTNLSIEKASVSAAIGPSQAAEYQVNYEFLNDILEGTEFAPGTQGYVDRRTLTSPHLTLIAKIRIDYDDINNRSYSTYVNFERVHYPNESDISTRHQYRMVDYLKH